MLKLTTAPAVRPYSAEKLLVCTRNFLRGVDRRYERGRIHLGHIQRQTFDHHGIGICQAAVRGEVSPGTGSCSETA